MASPPDFVEERHEGPEPRVLTEDVQTILRAVIRPGDEDTGKSVALIASRAGVSTRTVYRVLNPEEGRISISLELADNLTLAAGSHLSHCRLVWPGERVTPYHDSTLAAADDLLADTL